jgi:hypothetical protein
MVDEPSFTTELGFRLKSFKDSFDIFISYNFDCGGGLFSLCCISKGFIDVLHPAVKRGKT